MVFGIVLTCAFGGAVAYAQTAKVVRIGFLGPTSAASNAGRMEALRAGLRDLGYLEGKNLVIESRWAEGKFDRLPELAAELVRLNVDVILTAGTPGIRAAKNATTTIPIVMPAAFDWRPQSTPSQKRCNALICARWKNLFRQKWFPKRQ